MEIKRENRNIFLAIFLILALSLALTNIDTSNAATPLYVNGNTGSDTYDGTSATHTTGNIGPKRTIQNAITAVTDGGVVNVADGTYDEHLTISKSVTINGASRDNTRISVSTPGRVITMGGTPTVHINHVTLSNGDATDSNAGGAILNTGTLYISDSVLSGNTAYNGGAIYQSGSTSTTITDSTFSGNTATYEGGAIFNGGTLSITSSTLNGNTATYAGGAIFNSATLSITGSTLNSNTAVLGGAIFDASGFTITDSTLNTNHATNQGGAVYHCAGVLTITGSTIKDNVADSQGGAVYNIASGIMKFNRIIGNTPTIAIYGSGIDAKNNWWGSNEDPTGKVSAGVDVTSWMVFKSNANPTLIGRNGNSVITADLRYDNGNNYHDPVDGHIPDGTPVTFITTLGTIPDTSNTANGIAQVNLNGGTVSGPADVTATVDGVPIHSTVNIDAVLPTAQASVKGGLYNMNKLVALTMSKTGTIYYTTNGANPTTASTKYVNPILITKNTVLKFLAVDTVGNSKIYSVIYTIDKIPPKIVSTYPKNRAKKVSRTKTIYVKFNEKIKSSSSWSKIVVKNKNGKKVSIKVWINGNILYIKTLKKRSSNSYYTVYIPRYAVKDYAGNKLLSAYGFRFKTKI